MQRNIENNNKKGNSLAICYNRTMNKDLMLYVHIPFCVRKCAYCDFLSFAVTEDTKARYLAALHREIERVSEEYREWMISSIFIGGGTPSLLSGEEVKELMKKLKDHFTLQADAEITLECNPGTLTTEKAQAYKIAGINRISFGLQSADNEELKLLGRIHTYEEFLASYQLAREVGFTNINIDLMEGLPGQTKDNFLCTLEKVIALQPEHISMYSLIVEPGTTFYEKYGEAAPFEGELPEEEEERLTYYAARECMEAAGFRQYEISNFAKTQFACRHNVGYWERKDYLGLGLGAASLIEQKRFKNTTSIVDYMDGNCDYEEVQALSKAEQMEEYMFLGLRKTEGVSIEKFSSLYHVRMQDVYGTWIMRMHEEALLRTEGDRISLTNRGMDVSNYVLQGFLLD